MRGLQAIARRAVIRRRVRTIGVVLVRIPASTIEEAAHPRRRWHRGCRRLSAPTRSPCGARRRMRTLRRPSARHRRLCCLSPRRPPLLGFGVAGADRRGRSRRARVRRRRRTRGAGCRDRMAIPQRPAPANRASLPGEEADVTTDGAVNSGSKRGKRTGRARPHSAMALARLLLAAIVLCGIAHAGGRYFYCEAFGLSRTDPCAQSSDAGRTECPSGALHAQDDDCCTRLVLPAIPDGAKAEATRVPAPSLVAIAPAGPRVERVSANDRAAFRSGLVRWRTPPRPPGEARALLMVFLT
jgi:hypothetical protein